MASNDVPAGQLTHCKVGACHVHIDSIDAGGRLAFGRPCKIRLSEDASRCLECKVPALCCHLCFSAFSLTSASREHCRGPELNGARALRRTIPSLSKAGIAHPITCVCSALAANACEESSMRMAL